MLICPSFRSVSILSPSESSDSRHKSVFKLSNTYQNEAVTANSLPVEEMSSDLPDQHSVKRRRRPAKSCDACRARKVRCDQKIPCGPCTKARSAPKCIYGPGTVRLPSPDPSPEESGSGAAAPHTPAETRHYTPEASSLCGNTEAEQLRRQIAHLQNRVIRLESRLEADVVRPAVTLTTDLRVTPIQPKLRQTADKNKLFGANHWVHTAKHVRTRYQIRQS